MGMGRPLQETGRIRKSCNEEEAHQWSRMSNTAGMVDEDRVDGLDDKIEHGEFISKIERFCKWSSWKPFETLHRE